MESKLFPQPTNMPTQFFEAPSIPVDAFKNEAQPTNMPSQMFEAPSVPESAFDNNNNALSSLEPTSYPVFWEPEIYDLKKEMKAGNVTAFRTDVFIILLSIVVSIIVVLIFFKK